MGMKKASSKQFGATLDERERQVREDYEWALRNPEVCKAYGGKVVVVHQRTVWGAGDNHTAALEAARRRPGCPPKSDLAIVVVPEVPLGTGLS
jgi:hypothetical protein